MRNRRAAISGVVLAGGRSRRFGADKLAATMPDGRSLLERAVAAVATACDPVVVVLAPEALPPHGIPAEVIVAHDPEPFGGPLAGVLAGLEALAEAADDEVVVVVGGDMPYLNADVLALLGAELVRYPSMACARLGMTVQPVASVAPVTKSGALLGEEPALNHRASTPDGSAAILPCAVRLREAIEAGRASVAEGDLRFSGFLERMPTVVIPEPAWRSHDPGAATLRDVDRPGDIPVDEPING